jgi:hypothetical protein
MRLSRWAALGLLASVASVNAATVVINKNPFGGTTAPATPGRQIVNGPGDPINFNIATDVLGIVLSGYDVTSLSFANDLAANLPATGVNFIVLQNPGPLGAGGAADLIAAQLTDPTPGFFIYFNTGLDLPRLVFSPDLSDPTSDLSILGRLVDLAGAAGFAALPTITAANVAAIPEPSTMLLTAAGALLVWGSAMRRRSR